eukprot:7196611-Prymnesium_polylepis.1
MRFPGLGEALRIEHEVLWLEVAVGDVERVEVDESRADARAVEARGALLRDGWEGGGRMRGRGGMEEGLRDGRAALS